MNKRGYIQELITQALEDPNLSPHLVWQIMSSIGDKLNTKNPVQSINVVLRRMEAHGIAERYDGGWRLIPSKTVPRPASMHDGAKIQLSGLHKQREGMRVTLYISPDEMHHVIAIHLHKPGAGWIKFPVWGNVRICVGPETPQWTPDQETNTGFDTLRLICADGGVHERTLDTTAPITIDQEE